MTRQNHDTLLWQLHHAANLFNYAIIDVPGDGSCGLYALKVALPAINDTIETMRHRLADHLIASLESGSTELLLAIEANMAPDSDDELDEGMDASMAHTKAMRDLREKYNGYRARGDGQRVLDPYALVALAKIYDVDFAVLNTMLHGR